ncbi:antitoxin [Haloferula chungangensis]|uniref:Antitoxin n=1 Tax=Haloferula chungangensis TaxID=1048331 RepID=A0ABW2LDX2_9BACT
MDTAKPFKSGRSQAVRLPKSFRFEGDEVVVTRLGAAVVLEFWTRLGCCGWLPIRVRLRSKALDISELKQ